MNKAPILLVAMIMVIGLGVFAMFSAQRAQTARREDQLRMEAVARAEEEAMRANQREAAARAETGQAEASELDELLAERDRLAAELEKTRAEKAEFLAQMEAREQELADRQQALAAAPDAPAEDTPTAAEKDTKTEKLPPAEVKALFEKLAPTGLFAMQSKDMARLIKALRAFGEEGVDMATEWLLTADSPNARFVAAATLEGLADERSVPALSQALAEDESMLVRRMAAHALALGGFESGADALRKAAENDADWGVKANSLYGLGKQGDLASVDRLEELYGSEQTPAQYRMGLLGGLADIASPRSSPLFHHLLTNSEDLSELNLALMAVQKLADSSFLPDLDAVINNQSLDGTIREGARKVYNDIAGFEAR